jgi:preprotein translocase subunit SecD
VNKTKSIVVFAIAAVFIILMAVFGFIEFKSGLYDYTGFVRTIKLGLDMSGGAVAEYRVTNDGGENFKARVDGTIKSLESLLISKGYKDAQVTYQNQKIRVEVPDVDDPDRIFNLIGRPATLEFRSATGSDYEVLILGKRDLETAYVTADRNGAYAVGLKFNEEGTKRFADVTTEYSGKEIYIYVNGENALGERGISISEPNKTGIAVISGRYDYETAYELATKIQSGAFGVDLQIIESRLTSALLGPKALNLTLIAGGVGLFLIMVFMAVRYRMFGVAADIALLIYALVALWFFAVFPWVKITLPGIAGLLLGVGMAASAHVIIFERIRDEFKHTSKAIPSSIQVGFKRALNPIIDGNVVALLAAVVLLIAGNAAIQGFAMTLIISVVISLLTSLLLTRLFIKCLLPWNSAEPKFYNLKKAEVVTDED